MRRHLGWALATCLAGGCAAPHAPADSARPAGARLEAPASAPSAAAEVASATPAPIEPPVPASPPVASGPPIASAAPPAPAGPPLRPLPSAPDAELLREIASGRRSAAELVDPARGVSVVRGGPRPCDSNCPPEDQKLCGSDAAKFVEAVLTDAAATLDDPSMNPPPTSCTGMQCFRSPLGEWSPEEVFEFENGKNGLKLVSMTDLDVLLRDPADVAADEKRFPARLRALAARRCPATAPRP